MSMNADTGHSGAIRFAQRPAIRQLAAVAKRLIASVETSRQRRALAALSDHQLLDIGLVRVGFIHRAAVSGHCDAVSDEPLTAVTPANPRESRNSAAV